MDGRGRWPAGTASWSHEGQPEHGGPQKDGALHFRARPGERGEAGSCPGGPCAAYVEQVWPGEGPVSLRIGACAEGRRCRDDRWECMMERWARDLGSYRRVSCCGLGRGWKDVLGWARVVLGCSTLGDNMGRAQRLGICERCRRARACCAWLCQLGLRKCAGHATKGWEERSAVYPNPVNLGRSARTE